MRGVMMMSALVVAVVRNRSPLKTAKEVSIQAGAKLGTSGVVMSVQVKTGDVSGEKPIVRYKE